MIVNMSVKMDIVGLIFLYINRHLSIFLSFFIFFKRKKEIRNKYRIYIIEAVI